MIDLSVIFVAFTALGVVVVIVLLVKDARELVTDARAFQASLSVLTMMKVSFEQVERLRHQGESVGDARTTAAEQELQHARQKVLRFRFPLRFVRDPRAREVVENTLAVLRKTRTRADS